MGESLIDRGLLERFDRRKRSSVAVDLFMLASDAIATFDIKIKSLMERMRPDDGENAWRDDDIGQCMQLYGTICMKSEKSGKLAIELRLPEGFPDGLGRDVVRRARQHVEEWKKEYGDSIVVELTTMLYDGSGAVNSVHRYP